MDAALETTTDNLISVNDSDDKLVGVYGKTSAIYVHPRSNAFRAAYNLEQMTESKPERKVP